MKTYILDFEGQITVMARLPSTLDVLRNDSSSVRAALHRWSRLVRSKKPKTVKVPVHGTIYLETARPRTILHKAGPLAQDVPHDVILTTLNTPHLAYGMVLGEDIFECFILHSVDGMPLLPDSTNYCLVARHFCLGEEVPKALRNGTMTLAEALWMTAWETTFFVSREVSVIGEPGKPLRQEIFNIVQNARFQERAQT